MTTTACKLAKLCSGCPWIDQAYSDQIEKKKSQLLKLFEGTEIKPGEIRIISVGENQIRERTDLSWRKNMNGELSLGLHDLEHKEIVDIESCPQMTQDLQWWLETFRTNPPPILSKGSVRLRVSPDGQKGAWLDLAHVDIKALLIEQNWLRWLSDHAHVEIGQRFKPLIVKQDALTLSRTLSPLPWFETYLDRDLKPLPLFGVIGSFTQPGRSSNRALISVVMDLLRASPRLRILELFSGLGNFTLPLASLGHEVLALEHDPVSKLCFESTIAQVPSLAERISFIQKNLYAAKSQILPDLDSLDSIDALVVDPPRSGLRGVLDELAQNQRATKPKILVYVSCFAETLVSDLVRLKGIGFHLRSVVGVDQFPSSPHCEWVAFLERSY